MKKLRNYLVFGLFLLAAPVVHAQLNTLTQTTLSAKINNSVNQFAVASATNITVNNNTYNTDLYIDRELMVVTAVNGTTVTVLRGQGGTQAASHQASTMVLSGKPSAFQNFDPEGTCSTSAPTTPTEAVPAQPTINTRTSMQWLCSSLTGTWVPGFGNPGLSGTPITNTAAVASVAGSTLPSGPMFHVTGTNAITGWTIPVGCNATVRGSCSFTVIPDAVFTWTAAGNIAVASSALPGGAVVANHPIIFFWDATNSKWLFIPGA